MKRLGVRLLLSALALLLLAGLSGWQGGGGLPQARADQPAQRLLVIRDRSEPGDEQAFSQLEVALNLAHLQFDSYDINASAPLPVLDGYSAVVIVTETLWRLPGADALRIKEYVRAGGGLAVLYRAYNRVLRETFGMYNRRDPDFVSTAAQIEFVADLFPGVKGVTIPPGSVVGDFSSLAAIPLQGVRVLAQSAGDGRPLMWDWRFGDGRVIYWNNDWLSIREFRGYAIQSILSVLPVGVQASASWATIHIDDFPNAASTFPLEPIASEYGLRFVDWIVQVWLPDMEALQRKYGIPYTYLAVFNYNDLTRAPFDFAEWENARIPFDEQQILFGPFITNRVRRGRNELGLHGYNHISLLTSDWMRQRNMEQALEAVMERWQAENYGDPPLAYIAPNNLFDVTALAALRKTIPSIHVVATNPTGDFETGGQREFGPEPWDPYFYALPRWTDGYRFTDEFRFVMTSQVAMFGVWTHFVHADDVVNIPLYYPHDAGLRNPDTLPWRGDASGRNGLYYQFDEMLDFVTTTYPWLRFLTTAESYQEMLAYDASRPTFHFARPDELRVTFEGPPTNFIVRVNDGRRVDLNSLNGARYISHTDGEGYVLYVFEGLNEVATLRLFEP